MNSLNSLESVLLHYTLGEVLAHVEMQDNIGNYAKRNVGIMTAFSIAYALGYKVNIEYDVNPDIPAEYSTVVYIELPTGQVSWHLPTLAEIPYDGHSTKEKYERCAAYKHYGEEKEEK